MFFCFSVMEPAYCRTWLNLVTWTCGSWSEGQHDLYFTVQWFCLISWRLFDECTSNFGSMNQYDPMFDLKINVGHCDLYSMVQWFLPYILKTIWCINNIIWDYESVWPKVWPQNKNRSLVTYISWSSDFALYLEDYLMYVHHTLGVWISTTICLT